VDVGRAGIASLNVLALNAGSGSLRYKLFACPDGDGLATEALLMAHAFDRVQGRATVEAAERAVRTVAHGDRRDRLPGGPRRRSVRRALPGYAGGAGDDPRPERPGPAAQPDRCGRDRSGDPAGPRRPDRGRLRYRVPPHISTSGDLRDLGRRPQPANRGRRSLWTSRRIGCASTSGHTPPPSAGSTRWCCRGRRLRTGLPSDTEF
jgi:hypothetical protein